MMVIMIRGSKQPRQQAGRAGGGKVKAKIKVKLCKPAFLPFEKALLYARSLKPKSQKQWAAWRMTDARPANIPSTPRRARLGLLRLFLFFRHTSVTNLFIQFCFVFLRARSGCIYCSEGPYALSLTAVQHSLQASGPVFPCACLASPNYCPPGVRRRPILSCSYKNSFPFCSLLFFEVFVESLPLG